MVNKACFHVTKIKKGLHKVGKSWVIVSAAILGLIAGGTLVTNNVHANVNNDDNHDMQNNDSLITQKTSSASGNLVQSNGSQLSNGVNYSASTSTSINSNSTSSINTKNTKVHVVSAAQNIHKEIIEHSLNKINNKLRVGKNAPDQTLGNNGLISVINNNVKNGWNSDNAKDAYANLINFIEPESPLLSNAKLSGADWINGLYQVKSDLSTINNDGQPWPALSKIIINLNNITDKVNDVSDGIFGGLLDDLHYSLGDLAVRFDTSGGFAHSILQEFIPNENTLCQTGAVMRTLSSIDSDPNIKAHYANVISDLQKLPNQDYNQQSATLNDLSGQILDLATLINHNGNGYLPSQDKSYFNEIISNLNKASVTAHDESIIIRDTYNKSLKPESNSSAKSDQSSSASFSNSANSYNSKSVSSAQASFNYNSSQSTSSSRLAPITSNGLNSESSNSESSNQSASYEKSATVKSLSASNSTHSSSIYPSENTKSAINQNGLIHNSIASDYNNPNNNSLLTLSSANNASYQPSDGVSPWVTSLVASLEVVPPVNRPRSGSVTQRSVAAVAQHSVSDLNQVKVDQQVTYHDMVVTRKRPTYHWFEINKTCLAHNTLDSVGEVKDYGAVLHPGMKVHLDKIFKVNVGQNTLYRYEINVHGHDYFVTGNHKYTNDADYQANDLKAHRAHGRHGHRYFEAIVKKPFLVYDSSHFNKDNQLWKTRRGQLIEIKGVHRIGNVNRLALVDGTYITANREFTKLI